MLDAEKKLEQLARSLGAEAASPAQLVLRVGRHRRGTVQVQDLKALLCGLVMVLVVRGRCCGEPGALPAERRDEAPGWESEPLNRCWGGV